MKKIELLAPVGKIENAYAAIENGADAIFVGGKLFNARSYADNFEEDALKEIVEYAKLRDVKSYITLNTLIKNEELEALYNYMNELAKIGPDALIVQDLGVYNLARQYFPHMALHASTQMTAHSLEDVKFLESLGFKRVVLSRELQLKDIKEIASNTNVEIEAFVHGALCYCYSGQCMFSSFIGGRSGNRGKCAQTCRMQYSLLENDKIVNDHEYLMSPKDSCALSFIPELIDAGINSFKIEGRMKSPEYVASVVRTYRKYIDLACLKGDYTVDEEDVKELQSVFNRGGFSKGYYFQKSGHDMLTPKTPKNIGLKIGKVQSYDRRTKMATIVSDKELHPGDGLEIWNTRTPHVGTGISKITPPNKPFSVMIDKNVEANTDVYLSKNHELLKQLRKTYEAPKRKIGIHVSIVGELDKPIRVTLNYKNSIATAEGDCLITAENAPITKEMAIKQLTKLGSTSFKALEVECVWPENAYITVSKLNELRRLAVEILEKEIMTKDKAEAICNYNPILTSEKTENPLWVAHVRNLSQLEVCVENPDINAIYWEWQYDQKNSEKAALMAKEKGKDFYLALPSIVRNDAWKKYQESIKSWENTDIKGYLFRNYGEVLFFKDSQKEKIIDFTLNVFNNESIALWESLGIKRITASMELAKDELMQCEGRLEKVIYGHIPLMTTEQCVLGNYNLCKLKTKLTHDYKLKDRKEVLWPIMTDCVACKMQILTDKPILLDGEKSLGALGLAAYRLNFTNENPEEISDVLAYYFDDMPIDIEATRGIFFKGVE
ncbi:MAG: DUF3656 domain-containing protein [Cellulosilyticaceae bacterium]